MNKIKQRINTTHHSNALLTASMTGGIYSQAEQPLYDIVIYGDSSGAVIAAVAAKRQGRSVILLNPTGFLGGMGLPIIFSWVVGGFVAAGIAWCIGKVALGLRADYLAIATLGISEIIIAVLKNEDWLTRGVKNVTGLARPVPYEIDLQASRWFIDMIRWWHSGSLDMLSEIEQQQALKQHVIDGSSIFVKLCYTGLFAGVLIIILMLSIRALNSPWGRLMRAIRDNEIAAGAMGKDVTRRHLEIFVIGSAVVGIGGAMLTTLDGQFTPTSYQPLRYTFLIWVMVIVGGSGNNMGSVLGAFLIWMVWIEGST